MQSPNREPSMEDILASIKKVIAEEKELRTAVRPARVAADDILPDEEVSFREEDVLELDEPLAPAAELGPPLLDEDAAGHTRQSLEELQTVAAAVPAMPAVNPLE